MCGINLIIIAFCLSVTAGKSLRRIVPTTLEIREDEEMQIHLTEALKKEISCYVRTSQGVDCNLKTESNETCDPRINYWSKSGECGVYVRNVTKLDDGVWRLTSKDTDGKRIVDIAEIKVLDKYQATEVIAPISSGLHYTHPFPYAEKYCEVKHPHGGHSIVVTDDCKIELPIVTVADSGRWSTTLGVKGQLEEVVQTTNISVYQQDFITGYKWSSDSKTAHLYCNLADEQLEFCRFYNVKSKQIGLRLREGLRKGRYGYYGAGLDQGQCGLTIELPSGDDYSEWQCLIGVKSKKTPLGGSIQIISPLSEHNSENIQLSEIRAWASSPIITTVGHHLTLECFSNRPLSYCWFSQPNNTLYTRYSSSEENVSEDKVIYENKEIAIGKCSIIIPKVAEEQSGIWTCHMGPAPTGVEITANISVRVTQTLFAAIHKVIIAENAGDSITLNCRTVHGPESLQYCRFLSPVGFGINIHEAVTKDKAIQHNNVKYWYTGTGLNSGDCGLVIDHLKAEHIGEWTCATRLHELLSDKEEVDTVQVNYLLESGSLTAGAGVGIGIAVAAVVAAIGFSAYIVIKNRRRRNQQDNAEDTTYPERFELQRTSCSSSNASTNSSTSN